MKKCGYCGLENENNASHCRDCHTEFASTQALKSQAPLETAEIQSEALPGDKAIPSAPITAAKETSPGFPVEFCMLCGIAISAGGNFHMFVVIVIFYLFLKGMQARGDWELAISASGFTGSSIIQFLQMLAWHKSPVHFLEPVLVTSASVILLTARRRGLAWFLLVYSIFSLLINLLSALGFPRNMDLQSAVFRVVFFGLEIWLLVSWLWRKRPAGSLNGEGKHPANSEHSIPG